MKIPLKYTVRSLWTRRLTTILTITGIALVVFVFTAVLMMAYGIQKTMIETGSENNIIVLRKSATAEIMSIVMREQRDIITSLPNIAKGSEGKQLISGEMVVIINLSYKQKKGWEGTLLLDGIRSDPCDRLIGATALAEGIALVTKDRMIRNFKHIKTIW